MGVRRHWYGHHIGHNKRCRRPSQFCFVDCETQIRDRPGERTYTENELCLGVACLVEWRRGRDKVESWWQFATPDEFWQRLYQFLDTRRPTWVVAHNAIFDVTVLGMWERIESGELAVSVKGGLGKRRRRGNGKPQEDWHGLLAIDGTPFHVELSHANGRLNFSDLMNYYPCSLEDVAKSLGVEHFPVGKDCTDNEKWQEKCIHDVHILKTAYLSLVEKWQNEDNGNWAISAASLAWNNYRHKRDCRDIIVHQHSEAKLLEWRSYYGGECRAWYRGRCPAPAAHLDVNSLYPSVMAGNLYPIELRDYIVNPHLPIVESLAKRYTIVADCTIWNLYDDIPARWNGCTVYPVGGFRTVLCGSDFLDCLQSGCVMAVHVASYYRREEIFTDYVKRWWPIKAAASRDNDVPGGLLAKLMLNGLQGKFSQRSRVWDSDASIDCLRPWSFWPRRDPASGRVEQVRSIGWNAQVARNRKECKHSFPAISACITAYARQRMRQLRKDIPPHCLYYQDTDSLMVDQSWYLTEGQHSLPMGDGLGQMRLVGLYNQLEIRGPKNYTADGRHCISGVRKRDQQIGETTWVGDRMERASSIVTRDPDGVVRGWERIFDMPGTCREGGYTPDGWAIPLCLSLTKPQAVRQ